MPVEHAMNRNTVNFQIDEDLKRRFEDVCEAAGLSIQEACMRFAEASVRLNRIPFEASGHGSDAAEKTVTAEAPLAYAATADYFEKDGVPLRFDTKLWFRRPVEGIEPVCVGAVVGLNPGSSEATGRGVEGTVDATIGRVLTAFVDAFTEKGEPIPVNAFVRMLNLFYVRTKNSGEARRMLAEQPEIASGDFRDPAEKASYPFLWCAWTASTPARLVEAFGAARTEACVWLGADRTAKHGDPSSMARADVRHPLFKRRTELCAVVRTMLERGS